MTNLTFNKARRARRTRSKLRKRFKREVALFEAELALTRQRIAGEETRAA